ncbi:hypothetical protein [Nonomuraea maheshkhaliensis]|uniref:globin domain-containing protein n=1 Tax=Nonomuraea maheshkhaliensis TaxID=419590 RepID=UPI0031F7DC58
MYTHAGGEEALRRAEEIFYDKLLNDPVLKPLFPERRPSHVPNLTSFTAESFGGPDRFTCGPGFGHIVKVHRGLRITEAQRQRFVELYMQAIEEAGLPRDPDFLKAVHEHVDFGSHVAMQNSHAETDADLHPLRAVPRWTWAGDEPTDEAS